ncbi:hypothetical protein D3C87_1788790 [compost metagenome]
MVDHADAEIVAGILLHTFELGLDPGAVLGVDGADEIALRGGKRFHGGDESRPDLATMRALVAQIGLSGDIIAHVPIERFGLLGRVAIGIGRTVELGHVGLHLTGLGKGVLQPVQIVG